MASPNLADMTFFNYGAGRTNQCTLSAIGTIHHAQSHVHKGGNFAFFCPPACKINGADGLHFFTYRHASAAENAFSGSRINESEE